MGLDYLDTVFVSTKQSTFYVFCHFWQFWVLKKKLNLLQILQNKIQ